MMSSFNYTHMKSYPKRSEVKSEFHAKLGQSWGSDPIAFKFWERLSIECIQLGFSGFFEILILECPTTARSELPHFFDKIISTEFYHPSYQLDWLRNDRLGRLCLSESFPMGISDLTEAQWPPQVAQRADRAPVCQAEINEISAKLALKQRFEPIPGRFRSETNYPPS